MLYSSVYGHSRRICERIQSEIATTGHEAEIAPLGEGPDPAAYDGILIAASIRHGKHNPAVLEFIGQPGEGNAHQLRVAPHAGPMAGKGEQHTVYHFDGGEHPPAVHHAHLSRRKSEFGGGANFVVEKDLRANHGARSGYRL